jgi:hypothetical protein
MEEQLPDQPTSRGKRGPKPKQLHEKIVMGLPIGRDKKIVPPDEVFKLAALGLKITEIAEYFGVTDESIARNFADILTKARVELKISLRRAMLHNACVNNNAAVQIFLSKNLLGFSDNPMDSEVNAPLPWNDADI